MHCKKPLNVKQLIFLLFSIFSIYLQQINCQTNIQNGIILNATQYHFVPYGAFNQFCLSSMRLTQTMYNQTISKFITKVTFNIINPQKSTEYNILVFPTTSHQSQILYQSYKKAVAEGIVDLMPPFILNKTYPVPCSECFASYLTGIQPFACLNCTQTKFNISIQFNEQIQTWNKTILVIIDNTDLVFSIPGSQKVEFQFMMSYAIQIEQNQEYIALFILYFSVITALIIILAILAVILTLKIRKVDQQIGNYKQKIKNE